LWQNDDLSNSGLNVRGRTRNDYDIEWKMRERRPATSPAQERKMTTRNIGDDFSEGSTPRLIRIPSSGLRRAFARWLSTECRAGARLIVLEGLTGSGKTTLTKRPFLVDGKNIEIDQFFPEDTFIPLGTTYLNAINQQSLHAQLRTALASAAPVVVAEGPMVWPLIELLADMPPRDHIRRVYLKRMMHLQPDIWVAEDFLNNPKRWPPIGFHRSIWRYHAEHRPWLDADLVLERIEAPNEPLPGPFEPY
jgi:hypothetical protein